VPTKQTHRVRLARALAAVADISYHAALSRVDTAAQAGRLPNVLDQAGMRQALDVLATETAVPPASSEEVGATATLAAHYLRLSEVMGGPLPTAVARQVERVRSGGMSAPVCHGKSDPVDALQTGGSDADWMQRDASAGPLLEYELVSPYPQQGDLPIDEALDSRDATGDAEAYEGELRSITRAEPRDIDAWAHLGHLYFTLADPASPEIVFTSEPTGAQRRAWLRKALGFYQTGVAVGELALPDPFAALLPWMHLDNRPFLRALQGLSLALWRLGRFDEAELSLVNMLWLNPMDNQGARILLPEVRARLRWDDVRTH
jgi:hypothetical protein